MWRGQVGTDIYAFIDWETEDENGKEFVDCFARHVYLGRSYDLFGLLAGIRGGTAVYPPRGLPKQVSFHVLHEYTYVVTDKRMPYVVAYPEEAAGYVDKGIAVWWDETHTRVTNPDWHTPSWLNTSELIEIQSRFVALNKHPYLLLEAVIASMRVLDDGQDGSSRFIFWFVG
jgi:hypothetical protein